MIQKMPGVQPMKVELHLKTAPDGRAGGSTTAHVGTDGKGAAHPSSPVQQFRCYSQSGRDPTKHILGGLAQVVLVPGQGSLRDTRLFRKFFLRETAGASRSCDGVTQTHFSPAAGASLSSLDSSILGRPRDR